MSNGLKFWVPFTTGTFGSTAEIESTVDSGTFGAQAEIQDYALSEFNAQAVVSAEETPAYYSYFVPETDYYASWSDADECVRVFVDPPHYAKYLYPFYASLDGATTTQLHSSGTQKFMHKVRPDDLKLLESPFVQLHLIFASDNTSDMESGSNGFYWPESCTTFTSVQVATIDWWDVDNGKLRFQASVPGYISSTATQLAMLTIYTPPVLKLNNFFREHEWNPSVHAGWYSADDNENYLFARPAIAMTTGFYTDVYAWPGWIGHIGLSSIIIPIIGSGSTTPFMEFSTNGALSMTSVLDPLYNGPIHCNLPSEMTIFSSFAVTGTISVDKNNVVKNNIYFDSDNNAIQDLTDLIGPGIAEIKYAKRIHGFYYIVDTNDVLWRNNVGIWSSTGISINGLCEYKNKLMLLASDSDNMDCQLRILDQLMGKYVEVERFTINNLLDLSISFSDNLPGTVSSPIATANLHGIACQDDTIFVGVDISGTFTYADGGSTDFSIRDVKLLEVVNDNDLFVPCGYHNVSGSVVDLSFDDGQLVVLTNNYIHRLSASVPNRIARQVASTVTSDRLSVDSGNSIHLLSYNNIDILYTVPPVVYSNDGSNEIEIYDYTGSVDVHYRIKDSYSIEKGSGTVSILFDKDYRLPSIMIERSPTEYRTISVSVNPMVTGMTNRFICLSSKQGNAKYIDLFGDSKMIKQSGNYLVGLIKDIAGHPIVGQPTLLEVFDVIMSGSSYVVGAPAATNIIGLKPSTDEHGVCVYYLEHPTHYHSVALLVKMTTDDRRGYALLYKESAAPPFDLFYQIAGTLE